MYICPDSIQTFIIFICCYLLSKSCPILVWPQGLQPARLLCPWGFPGKKTGMGCHFLLQGILPLQESNPCLLHCRWTLYHWTIGEGPEPEYTELKTQVRIKENRTPLVSDRRNWMQNAGIASKYGSEAQFSVRTPYIVHNHIPTFVSIILAKVGLAKQQQAV